MDAPQPRFKRAIDESAVPVQCWGEQCACISASYSVECNVCYFLDNRTVIEEICKPRHFGQFHSFMYRETR